MGNKKSVPKKPEVSCRHLLPDIKSNKDQIIPSATLRNDESISSAPTSSVTYPAGEHSIPQDYVSQLLRRHQHIDLT